MFCTYVDIVNKQIIIAKLFEFGGSNSHLKTIIKYFGAENVILILDDTEQAKYLSQIDISNSLQVKIVSRLRAYAHLIYPSQLSNIKEFLGLLTSLSTVLFLCVKNRSSSLTISVVEPEKYLYLLWLPFIRVTYIVHTTPQRKYTAFTSYTCNSVLGRKKQLITVSKSNKELICENWDICGQKRGFVKVIYNCINQEAANTVVVAAPGTELKTVVTMGHVASYKNPAVWLQVAQNITVADKNVRFLWLGNGPLWEEFDTKTTNDQQIHFLGTVNNPESYLERAVIYYQPSIHETHGIAVLEAMYHSLPCVVSNAGGLPESIEDGYNGLLVDPLNVDEHCAALMKLIADPQLRLNYGNNAFKKYEDLFSYKKFKAEMDRVYLN